MSSLRVGFVVAGALTALVIAAPVSAQDALIVDGQFVSASRAFGEPLGAAPDALRGRLAGGGRFAVLGDSTLDRVIGTIRAIPPVLTVVAVDPLRPRLFVRESRLIDARISAFDIVTGAVQPLIVIGGSDASEQGAVQYAAAADRLFVDTTPLAARNLVPSYTHTISAVDASTGAAAPGGFTFQAGGYAPWLVTPEGDMAYAALPGALESINLATGLRRVLAQPVTGLQWDEGFERLYARVGATVFVLTRDGTPLGSAAMGFCYNIAASVHTGRLYVRREDYRPYGVVSDLRVFDGATFALLGQVSVPFPEPSRCEARVYSAPGAPRNVTARVAGHDVVLSWVNVGAASRTVLDVGLAPGRTDLSITLGPGPTASFAAVPSGTYYVRLRGGNEFGGGRPSQEVTLVVP